MFIYFNFIWKYTTVLGVNRHIASPKSVVESTEHKTARTLHYKKTVQFFLQLCFNSDENEIAQSKSTTCRTNHPT